MNITNIINTAKKCLSALIILCSISQTMAAERVTDYTRNKLARELPVLGLTVGDPVFIRTFKKESRLELWMQRQGSPQYILFRTYPICYYSGTLGPKRKTGDKMTPEGFYAIQANALNPNSRFHLSMNVGYPNAYDRSHGYTGSLLMIHGECDAIGCFAMGNEQIEEIYYLIESALQNGQANVPVHAFPFHLNDANMNLYQNSPWRDFWQQLKAGYDKFNAEKIPPTIRVENGRYQVL